VRVTSWLHEEGAAVEILPEDEPRGKYTLLRPQGHLLVHHTSAYDAYKRYTCRAQHLLTGAVVASTRAARLKLEGDRYSSFVSFTLLEFCNGRRSEYIELQLSEKLLKQIPPLSFSLESFFSLLHGGRRTKVSLRLVFPFSRAPPPSPLLHKSFPFAFLRETEEERERESLF